MVFLGFSVLNRSASVSGFLSGFKNMVSLSGLTRVSENRKTENRFHEIFDSKYRFLKIFACVFENSHNVV